MKLQCEQCGKQLERHIFCSNKCCVAFRRSVIVNDKEANPVINYDKKPTSVINDDTFKMPDTWNVKYKKKPKRMLKNN